MADLPIFTVVGVGEMAEAMVRFALDAGWPRDRLILTHHRAERRAELMARYGGRVEADNLAAVQRRRGDRRRRAAPAVRRALERDPASAARGSAADLDCRRAGPALVGAAPARRHAGRSCRAAARQPRPDREQFSVQQFRRHRTAARLDRALFEPVGKRLVWLPDELLEAVTAIGPGITPHVVLLVDTLIKFGIEQGVPADLAREVVYEGLSAAAERISGSGLAPDEMIQAIATPGGLTQAALNTLEKAGRARGLSGGHPGQVRPLDGAARRSTAPTPLAGV